MPPRALVHLRVRPSTHINETDRMVDGVVLRHQDIWDPPLQQTMLLGMSPISFRKCTLTSGSLNRTEIFHYIAGAQLRVPIRRGRNEGITLSRRWYVDIAEFTCAVNIA